MQADLYRQWKASQPYKTLETFGNYRSSETTSDWPRGSSRPPNTDLALTTNFWNGHTFLKFHRLVAPTWPRGRWQRTSLLKSKAKLIVTAIYEIPAVDISSSSLSQEHPLRRRRWKRLGRCWKSFYEHQHTLPPLLAIPLTTLGMFCLNSPPLELRFWQHSGTIYL